MIQITGSFVCSVFSTSNALDFRNAILRSAIVQSSFANANAVWSLGFFIQMEKKHCYNRIAE